MIVDDTNEIEDSIKGIQPFATTSRQQSYGIQKSAQDLGGFAQ